MKSEAKQMLNLVKAAADGLSHSNDAKAIGAIAAASSAAAVLGGDVTVATVITAAPGILGALGLSVTSTVALPAVGIVAGLGLAAFGVHKVVGMAAGNKDSARSV